MGTVSYHRPIRARPGRSDESTSDPHWLFRAFFFLSALIPLGAIPEIYDPSDASIPRPSYRPFQRPETNRPNHV